MAKKQKPISASDVLEYLQEDIDGAAVLIGGMMHAAHTADQAQKAFEFANENIAKLNAHIFYLNKTISQVLNDEYADKPFLAALADLYQE